MRTPDEIAALLRQRFDRDFPTWARDGGTWPMRLGLFPPTVPQRSADPIACHTWADQWRAYPGPGRIETGILRFSTGSHEMPKRIVFDTPHQVAASSSDTHTRWQTCAARLTELQRSFPKATFTGVIRRITDLPEADYACLTAAVTWLNTNPTSGMLIRQLPIEGMDTKWLARHAHLVLALRGDETAPHIDNSGDEPILTMSRRREIHRRLGLRTPPELIQITVPCPTLRKQIGGMRHLAASIDDLNAWPEQPDVVIIIENKETAYALTTNHPGMIVLHGEGFDVAGYARLTWVHTATKVVYWGDVDLAGLHALDDLRAYGLQVHSILTDLPTLNTYRHLAVEGAAPYRKNIGHLTGPERELYDHLYTHAKATGHGLLLEQERIPWAHARSALMAATRQSDGGC
ncbi:MAG TPA: Wadjet anti-phage system protein JetD domain-containing protein [Pseudonocardiaceae bacterium]|nr:Wadjet anti-phage system protein JetD domain-containing protein [Pseudonocardiaceae bacterium]